MYRTKRSISVAHYFPEIITLRGRYRDYFYML